MPGAAVVRDQVHPWLDDRPALAVRAHRVLDRTDDLRAGQAQPVNVGPGHEPDPQASAVRPAGHGPWPAIRAGTAQP